MAKATFSGTVCGAACKARDHYDGNTLSLVPFAYSQPMFTCLLPTTTSTPPTHLLPPPFKKLTNSKIQQKREKGLCFRCDERFSQGHRCKQKTLQVLWVIEDEVEDKEDLPTPKPTVGEDPLAEGLISAVLCVSSLVGFYSPHSMKVRGKING